MILSTTANVTLGEKNSRTKKTKQKNRTTYFMQAANVTLRTEVGGRLQRLLGRATRVRQEVRV